MKWLSLVVIFSIVFCPGNLGAQQSWNDRDGNFINAHGAGILYHDGVYYMYGEIKKGKTWLVPDQNWECYRVPAGGISCYSSKDLLQWTYEGVALAPLTGDSTNELDTSRVIERPKVIYNSSTKKFVMWMHIDRKDYSYARAGVAISDNPSGPYKYLGSIRPNGQMARDMSLFKDDDNKAYLIYSSENNNTMHVCLLTHDYLAPTKTYSRILEGRNREAPALFKNKDKYYLVTSGCTGWSPNAASCAVASQPLGPWNEYGNPCQGAGAETTFQSQGTFVLPLKDKPGEYIFMADRWNKTNLEKSTYIWLRLHLSDDKIEISNVPFHALR
ncbi:MAG TPA: glycoside hydrolase family 43 protein [Chitinophagaceae bacterium]|nr:glycoside hydrolase family 43 protein [Chitinophagaceae bacterium]